MIRHTPRVRHDRQRWIGSGRGWEGPSVDNIEVLHVVGAAALIEHRFGRIVAHPDSTVLMGAVARDFLDVQAPYLAGSRRLEDLAASIDDPSPLR